MAEAPGTLEGWNVLHDFRRFDWPKWKALPAPERQQALTEAEQFLSSVVDQEESSGEGASALYSMIGHRSDMLLLYLRPTVEELGALERGFQALRLADFTSASYSYLSVTELSLYEAKARGGTDDPQEMMKLPFVRKRLFPEIPPMKYICFYPMNKRRGEILNWYAASMEERRHMMREHGSTGHKYHGQVLQMITGSTGLDDWEWGITLWSDDTLPIKKLVYEMRFDEVSAKYGEFGPFQVGVRVQPGELPSILKV